MKEETTLNVLWQMLIIRAAHSFRVTSGLDTPYQKHQLSTSRSDQDTYYQVPELPSFSKAQTAVDGDEERVEGRWKRRKEGGWFSRRTVIII